MIANTLISMLRRAMMNVSADEELCMNGVCEKSKGSEALYMCIVYGKICWIYILLRSSHFSAMAFRGARFLHLLPNGTCQSGTAGREVLALVQTKFLR